MDYETPDGSQFCLREIWRNTEPGGEDWPEFVYTTISATVDGKAYFGRLHERADDVYEGDILSALEPVPPEAIYPAFDNGLTEAPAFDPSKHYLKAPSFTWDNCQPGVTFVADCVMNEVRVLERLKSQHRNIVEYYGCVVSEGRITHICLERCNSNFIEYAENHKGSLDLQKIHGDIRAGIEFLHSLGLAHNDINPDNICIVEGRPVIVDFDSCASFGQKLLKGVSVAHSHTGSPISAPENDYQGLDDLGAYLADLMQSTTNASPA